MTQNQTPSTQLKKFQEETVGQVLAQVQNFQETGELVLPEGYAVGNALKSAWLILLETKDLNKRPVLEVCSKESICNALLDMSVMGLSPMKKQCAFIAYGNKLTMQPEYHGNIALAKRYGKLDKVFANVIYEGDVFEYGIDPETGVTSIIKHEPKLENINPDKIKGAYAVTILTDGARDLEVMNMAQIKKAWNQGPMKGNSPAHKNFPDQMAKKTVINRAVKLLISSSDDSALAIAKQDPVAKPQVEDAGEVQVLEEINIQANQGEEISMEESEKAKSGEKATVIKEEAKVPEKKESEQSVAQKPQF